MTRPSKKWGYCRVSRPKQNIERQVRNILAVYPDAVILKEIYTRTAFEGRTVWDRLMKTVQPGDVIIFDSVSRMSGNEEEGIQRYMELFHTGIDLIFLNEPHINTATYKSALNNKISMTGTNADFILEGVNKFLVALAEEQIRIAFAQSAKEVADLRTRTKGGIETARIKGKTIGRPCGRTYETKKAKESKKRILLMAKDFGGKMTDKECIEVLGISRNSYYKYKDQLLEQQATTIVEINQEEL